MAWFQDQKFGFMMHWAPYSQWGCIESWPLVADDKWAATAKDAGMKYVVFTP